MIPGSITAYLLEGLFSPFSQGAHIQMKYAHTSNNNENRGTVDCHTQPLCGRRHRPAPPGKLTGGRGPMRSGVSLAPGA